MLHHGRVREDRPADDLPPAAALLWRPAAWARDQILTALREAGYDDLMPAHLGVFGHPGPDGQRPGVLALRTNVSKQAMNHLLRQLEDGGYLIRETDSRDGRSRRVRLTRQGRAAAEVIREAVTKIETSWVELLGTGSYHDLQRALQALDTILDDS